MKEIDEHTGSYTKPPSIPQLHTEPSTIAFAASSNSTTAVVNLPAKKDRTTTTSANVRKRAPHNVQQGQAEGKNTTYNTLPRKDNLLPSQLPRFGEPIYPLQGNAITRDAPSLALANEQKGLNQFIESPTAHRGATKSLVLGAPIAGNTSSATWNECKKPIMANQCKDCFPQSSATESYKLSLSPGFEQDICTTSSQGNGTMQTAIRPADVPVEKDRLQEQKLSATLSKEQQEHVDMAQEKINHPQNTEDSFAVRPVEALSPAVARRMDDAVKFARIDREGATCETMLREKEIGKLKDDPDSVNQKLIGLYHNKSSQRGEENPGESSPNTRKMRFTSGDRKTLDKEQGARATRTTNPKYGKTIQTLDVDKNTLLIDSRAAPRENISNGDDLSILEALAASGHQFRSTERNEQPSRDLIPPTRKFRTPADGYNIHADAKARVDCASLDGSTPGAFAVAQRAIGSRPAWNGSRVDSMGESSDGVSYHGSSHGIVPSSIRSVSVDGVSTTNGNQESAGPGSSVAVTQVWCATSSDSMSHIPPEMRILPRNGGLSTIFSRFSRNSEDTTNAEGRHEDRKGEPGCIHKYLVQIIVGTIILVVGLGAGLAFGLGGKDDEGKTVALSNAATASTTSSPTSLIDFLFYQSVVEDLYEDSSIFEDATSPQYHALVWLASDPQNELLGVDKIRSLYALTVFYYSTNGDDFINEPTWEQKVGFLETTNECEWNNIDDENDEWEWMGVICDDTAKVQAMYFGSNNLIGTFPEEIAILTNLEILLLGRNQLSSTIPKRLFELPNLNVVDVGANLLSGSIPSSLSTATKLEVLHLGYNQLQGSISFDQFDNSDCKLRFLVLAENEFSGTFPLESIAANCTNMNTLHLGASGLMGGQIPSFGFEQLMTLNLQKMQLTGELPDSISRLTRLENLMLDFNDLQGTLPTSLGQLTTLEELTLSYNRFDGAIPSILGQLQQLIVLDLRMNLFSGALPSELALCTNLERAQLERNFLSGNLDFFCPLPPDLIILSSDCSFGDITCSCCTECI